MKNRLMIWIGFVLLVWIPACSNPVPMCVTDADCPNAGACTSGTCSSQKGEEGPGSGTEKGSEQIGESPSEQASGEEAAGDASTPERTPEQSKPDTPIGNDNAASPSCYSVLQCSDNQCKGTTGWGCLDKCAAPLKGDDKARWTRLKACAFTKCSGVCKPGDRPCENDCFAARCSQEWMACGVGTHSGANSCKDVGLCMSKCKKEYSSCLAKCAAEGTKTAQAQISAIISCDSKERLKLLTEQEKRSCKQRKASCLCPQIRPGQGSKTCAEFWPCSEKCQNDVCCEMNCTKEISPGAYKQLQDLYKCVETKCSTRCKGQDPTCLTTCTWTSCSKTTNACVCPSAPSPGSGAGKCLTGFQCFQKCAKTDLCCNAKCLGTLGQGSLQKFVAIAECLPTCGCNGDKQCEEKCTKVGGKCYVAAQACVLDK